LLHGFVERESSAAPLFEAHALGVAAGGKLLLADIDIRIERHGRLFLSGPSGAGKSSLLRTLAGLDAPAAGRIVLEGRPPHSWGWPRYRRRVNLLFQKPLLLEGSLAGNLELPFGYSSAEGSYRPDRARELLDLLGLSAKRFDENPRGFSVGEQQRICLVRSLLAEPQLLLLDEPVSALDAESGRRVLDLVDRESRARGMAVVLAGHDIEAAGAGQRLDLADYRVDRAS